MHQTAIAGLAERLGVSPQQLAVSVILNSQCDIRLGSSFSVGARTDPRPELEKVEEIRGESRL